MTRPKVTMRSVLNLLPAPQRKWLRRRLRQLAAAARAERENHDALLAALSARLEVVRGRLHVARRRCQLHHQNHRGSPLVGRDAEMYRLHAEDPKRWRVKDLAARFRMKSSAVKMALRRHKNWRLFGRRSGRPPQGS
jgi:hypothetical protein